MSADEFAAGSRSKSALIRRLRRIEGQARGLQLMVEHGRDPAEILMQIASVRVALHGAATLILRTYLVDSTEAIALAGSPDENERAVAKAVEVFRKWAT